MPLMFGILNALYLEKRNLAVSAISGANKRSKDKPDAFTLGLFLDDPDEGRNGKVNSEIYLCAYSRWKEQRIKRLD